MDEVHRLVSEYGKKAPGDRDAAGEVAFGGGERIRRSGTFEEKEGEEDEAVGPDVGGVCGGVSAEG